VVPYALRHPRLFYERRGSGDPVLLITGFTISSAIFEPVIDRYAEGFDVITYDNRGAGRSDAPWRPTSIPELAGDAARLLDALEVESAHVYGVSLGGMVAQELALRFPERVRGLILGCTSAGGPRAARMTARELRAASAMAAGELGSPGRPWRGAFLFSPEFRRDQPERVRWLLEHFGRHRAPPQGIAAHWWASVFHDTVDRLDQIQAPTLVFHGERDVLSPLGNARLLADRIPDAELAVVPGAGHGYALERPDMAHEFLIDWLERRSPITAGRPRTGLVAQMEPVTRTLGLTIGAVRTGRSMAALGKGRLRR
jgi:pimeloyl-ACP methyl ester carboxylesterase